MGLESVQSWLCCIDERKGGRERGGFRGEMSSGRRERGREIEVVMLPAATK